MSEISEMSDKSELSESSDSFQPTSIIILNSKSGCRMAQKTFMKWLRSHPHVPILIYYCDSKFSEFLTVHDTYLPNIQSILLFGGDGTIHNVLNELLEHSLQIPMILYPIGSGNGLYHSLNHYYQSSSLSLQHPVSVNLLNMTIRQHQIERTLHSVLSMTWGIISDIDLRTEWLRWLGNFRFDMGGLWYILRKLSYHGTLTYQTETNESVTISKPFISVWASNTPYLTKHTMASPKSVVNDGWIYLCYIVQPITRIQLAIVLLQLSNGTFIKHPYVHYVKTRSFSLTIQNGTLMIDGEHYQNITSLSATMDPEKTYPFQISND